MIIDQPDGFARAALGTIAIMGFAKLLAGHKTAAGTARSISAGVENQQRVRPCSSLAAHTPELLRTTKPLITSHLEIRTTGTQHRSNMMVETTGSSEDTHTSSIRSKPCYHRC
jgi:hypothetical protein